MLGTTRKNTLVVTNGLFLLVLLVAHSPSRAGLPVGGVESRESGHKVATIGCSSCRRQLLWRYRKNKTRGLVAGQTQVCLFVCKIVFRI